MHETQEQLRKLEEKVASLEVELNKLKSDFQNQVPLTTKNSNMTSNNIYNSTNNRQPFENPKQQLLQHTPNQVFPNGQPYFQNNQNFSQYNHQRMAQGQPFYGNPQGVSQNPPLRGEPTYFNGQFYQPPKKKDWENTIGKNVLGIVASALIFISLILFSTLIFKDVSDIGKSILLFLGSFLVLLVGFFLQKKMANAFSLSIIGCGMGCIYLSLIICHIQFHFISRIVLFLLFFGWVIGMAILCRKLQSIILCGIGQVGLSLSILLGILTIYSDVWLWFSLCVYALVSVFLYFYICNLNTHKGFTDFTNMYTQVHLLLIAVHNETIYGRILEPSTSLAVKFLFYFIGCFIFALFLYYLYDYAKESFGVKKSIAENGITQFSFSHLCNQNGILHNNFRYQILTFVSLINTFIGFSGLTGLLLRDLRAWDLLEKHSFIIRNWIHFIFIIILLICAILYVEWVRHRNKQIANNGSSVLLPMRSLFHTGIIPFLLVFFVIGSFQVNVVEQGVLLFISLALLWYGFAKIGKLYQISGFLLLVLHTICFVDAPFYMWMITLFAYVAVYVLLAKYKQYYNIYYKAVLYIMSYFFSSMIYNEFLYVTKIEFPHSSYEVFFYLLLVTPLQLIATKTKFVQSWINPASKEKLMYILVRGINFLLLCMGTSLFYKAFPIWIYVFLILITSSLCGVGMQQFLKEHDNSMLAGFYVGLKYTTFIYAIIKSTPYDTGIFISICLLIIAIVFILLGFLRRLKSLRIYGLSLTMISIVKLILIDISHKSTLQTVFALLICGILCFCINFIYNVLSKKLGE